MSMEHCLFCQMASGAMPVEKLYEDDKLFALNDLHPRAPIHMLIIPREHIPTARDVDERHGPLLAAMFQTARRLAEERGILADGYRLAVNVGENGGQTIFHLHMHVLGGRKLGAEG